MTPIGPADVTALGPLLLSAYRGTVHDEGETEEDAVAEVDRTLAGEYGSFLARCSFIANEGPLMVGASLVTLPGERPLLAHLLVRAGWKRKGIGTSLLDATGNELLSAGHPALDLYVTEGNEPAVSLYRKAGFEVVRR